MSAATTPFPDKATVADKFSGFAGTDLAYLQLLMENPEQDQSLFGGLELYLDQASAARFLNTLKLEKCGEWLGNAAPARLQIRLSELARSSQHPAYLAFKAGVTRSGGLERAYPKAKL